ncbi:hypothetical protein RCR19_16385 [Streptomyces sp. WAC07094]|jgi:hypothetical protein|uniref:hypothetical protein n=1 Tax=Streptomyces sp. WAC07094 TaxID=3072183 RepID=UPI002E9DB4DD|nr:hypothetical protein [Streptomyces sp. WAC07094]
MRKWMSGALGAAVVVGAAMPATALGSEVDIAYHGYVAMGRGEVNVRLTPTNLGPSIEDATVRLHWSKPLAKLQQLPRGCARHDVSTVVCGTGELTANGKGREIHLRLRLADTATDEVRLEIDSVWGDDEMDRNPGKRRQQVLVLATGDRYTF